MCKNEAEVNAHPFGHGFTLEGKEVVGFEREMDRISERKFHTEVWIDKEKGLFMYHRICLSLPVSIGTGENEQGGCLAAPYAYPSIRTPPFYRPVEIGHHTAPTHTDIAAVALLG